MLDMEWPAMAVHTDHGGVGAGHYPLGVIFEELGRNLVLSPLIAVCQALSCLQNTGGDRAAALLQEVMTGHSLATVAHQEGAHHSASAVTTHAEQTPQGYRLSGTKRFVLYGAQADAYLVSARLSGDGSAGLALFVVNAGQTGLSIEPLRLMDAQPRAHVRLSEVAVDHTALLAGPDSAACVLDEATDIATGLLAAEMLGSLSAALQLTVNHLQQRVQFGTTIGSFQALQHRAARMLVAQEMTTSTVRAALRCLDESPRDAAEPVSVAKLWANDAFDLIAREGVQMHGGLGMTDEVDIGLYLKRARVTSAQWGDSGFHRRRIAAHKLAGGAT
jgi:alkylation response protein AidB-like acyl-CoA dehydrogenase